MHLPTRFLAVALALLGLVTCGPATSVDAASDDGLDAPEPEIAPADSVTPETSTETPTETATDAPGPIELTCAEVVAAVDACASDAACRAAAYTSLSAQAREAFDALVACQAAACGPLGSPECFGAAREWDCRAEWDNCTACEPMCSGKACGPDGCGGLCGDPALRSLGEGGCGAGQECQAATCVTPCTTNAECADDQVCALADDGVTGRCEGACTTACPGGAGLSVLDGCHCRTVPTGLVSCRIATEGSYDTDWSGPCSEIEGDPLLALQDGTSSQPRPALHDLGDGSVVDDATGLVWAKDTSPLRTWAEAMLYCTNNNWGLPGEGWRAPTLLELLGLARFDSGKHAWGDGIFQWRSGSEEELWTGTEVPYGALVVGFGPAVAATSQGVDTQRAIRCVRGGSSNEGREDRFLRTTADEIVDRVTGLAWDLTMGCAACSWVEALTYCSDRGPGWRTPDVQELASLLDFSDPMTWGPHLAPAFLTGGSPFRWAWSATPVPSGAYGQAIGVDFMIYKIGGNLYESDHGVRCVRDAADGDGVRDDSSESGVPGDHPCTAGATVGCDDNCPGVANPDQVDLDGDGVGAACDWLDHDEPLPWWLDLGPAADAVCVEGGCGLGLVDERLLMCGWCSATEVCRDRTCHAVTCTTDADCASDEPYLPGDLVRRCDVATGSCEFRLADGSMLLSYLQQVHRGASVLARRDDRLTRFLEPEACLVLQAYEGNPSAGTCCESQGGPDYDGDRRCTYTAWDWSDAYHVWPQLGVEVLGDTPLVFRYEGGPCPTPQVAGDVAYRAEAYDDLDCDQTQSTFSVLGRIGVEPRTLTSPQSVAFRLVGATTSVDGEIPLTDAQRTAFEAPPNVVSLNPFYAEARATLDDLLTKAIAEYEAVPPEACPTWWAWGPAIPNYPIYSCCTVESAEPPSTPQLCPVDLDTWALPPWSDLGFAVTTPSAFVYTLEAWPDQTGTVPFLQVTAYGDLDCDGHASTFRRFAHVESGPDGCKATAIPGLLTFAETE